MGTISVIYQGDLRTKATHLPSGNSIITDAPVDNNGKGEAFSPTDLVCSALGSCMLTIMGIVANRHDINIEGTIIDITKIMSANPRKIEEIILKFKFPENNFSDQQKTLLEKAAMTCPVAISLDQETKQTVEFEY